MTAIRAALTRSVNPLLVRPQPAPQIAQTSGAGEAGTAKAGTSVVADTPSQGPSVVSAQAASVEKTSADQGAQATPPQISDEVPAPTLDTKVQKALTEAYEKFHEGEGGSLADLQRALYDSVWNLYNDAGAKDSPVKAAMSLTSFLNNIQDQGDAPSISKSANAAIASVNVSTGASSGDESGGTTPGVRTPVDIQI